MNGDLALLARLVAVQAVLQLLLAGLARALGRRLPWHTSLLSHALPWLLLAPWLTTATLLVPTGNLDGQIPGAPQRELPDYHSRQLNDVTLQFLPWELDVRRAFASGRLPFWSDLVDGGSSPWANPQASVLSPIALLARAAPLEHHLLFALALKMVVAFQGAWIAARLFGARRAGATVAAAGFALSGGLLAWALFAHSNASAWVPWCFGASLLVVRRPRARTLLAAAASYLALFLSGQPEIAFGGAAFATLFALLAVRRRRPGKLRAMARLLIAGTLAFGLAAPILLPFVDRIAGSQREHDLRLLARAQLAPGEGTFRLMREGFPRLLLGPLSPWAFGVPYRNWPALDVEPLHAYASYAGLAAVAGIAVLFLTGAGVRRAALLLACSALLVGLLAEIAPLVWIWRRLPGLGMIVPTRLMPLASLGLTLVGGLGIDRLLRHPRRAVPAILVLVTLAVSWAIAPSRTVALVAVGIAGAAAVARRSPRLALVVLLLALGVDQLRWSRHLLPQGEAALFYPVTPEVATLQRLAGGPGGRVVGHDFLLYPSLASVYGLYDPRPHNPLAAMPHLEVLAAAFDYAPSSARYFSHFLAPEHPLLDFLGVRAVYSNVYLPNVPGMPIIQLPGGIYVVATNLDALPPYFLATRFDRVPDGALADWIRALDDPRRVALATPGSETVPAVESLIGGDVAVVATRPGSIALAVPPEGTKLLATSIPGPRGWSARAADRRLSTVTIDGGFLGVVVPPGPDRVELVYRPPRLVAGLLLAAVSLATALAIALRPRRFGLLPAPRR